MNLEFSKKNNSIRLSSNKKAYPLKANKYQENRNSQNSFLNI